MSGIGRLAVVRNLTHRLPVNERYTPPSDFLKGVLAEDVEFDAADPDDANLKRLLALTRDADVANRDWATLLLAQLQLNRPDVTDALVAATSDVESCVRAEAVLGLAQLDKSLALPFLRNELSGPSVSMPLLEAATIVADPSLAADLEAFAQPSDNPHLDDLVLEALRACRLGH